MRELRELLNMSTHSIGDEKSIPEDVLIESCSKGHNDRKEDIST